MKLDIKRTLNIKCVLAKYSVMAYLKKRLMSKQKLSIFIVQTILSHSYPVFIAKDKLIVVILESDVFGCRVYLWLCRLPVIQMDIGVCVHSMAYPLTVVSIECCIHGGVKMLDIVSKGGSGDWGDVHWVSLACGVFGGQVLNRNVFTSMYQVIW